MQNAQEIAATHNHGELKALHLLLALLSDAGTLVQPIVAKVGINLDELVVVVEERLKSLPKTAASGAVGQLYLSIELMQILDRSGKIAQILKDEFVSCEHLFLSLLESQSEAKNILEKFNLKRESFMKVLAQLRGSVRVTDETPESKFQVLEKYSVNLTKQAKEGKLDPVI